MKTRDELINSIVIDKANLLHIAETGNINGSLRLDIDRVMMEYLNQENEFDELALRIDFDEYMMSGNRKFTPDTAFAWLKSKVMIKY